MDRGGRYEGLEMDSVCDGDYGGRRGLRCRSGDVEVAVSRRSHYKL